MKIETKIIFLLGLLAVLLVVVSCVPGEGAIAGKATDLGNRDRTVRTCTESSSGSITVATGGRLNRDGALTGARSTTLSDGCSGSTFSDYSCSTPTMQRLHQVRCDSAERCVNDAVQPCVARCIDSDPTNDIAVRGVVTITQTGVTTRDSCLTPSARVPTGSVRQVDCAGGRLRTLSPQTCPSGTTCGDGVCATLPPTVTVAGLSVTPTVETAGDVTIVSVAGSPVLEVTSGTVLNGVSVEVSADSSQVATAGLAGISHVVYLSNANGNGVYVCPNAESLAAISSDCPNRITYTCIDPSITSCQSSDGWYRVTVSGTGVAALPPETVETCSTEPSCGSPNYEVTSTTCTDSEAMGGGVESCYTCSVREDLRAGAECPEGWGREDNWNTYYGDVSEFYPDNVDWYGNGFYCRSGCVNDCHITISNPQTECVDACPTVATLSSPCPEGYTFTENILPSRVISEYSYYCIFSGATQYDHICNQCGSDGFGGSGGNGDIFCMIRS